MRRASSFSEYLEQNRDRLARRLIEKAYVANRIAKVCVGRQRKRLYGLKTRYLSAAFALMPNSFLVDSRTIVGNGTVLVGVTSSAGFRFHVCIEEVSKEREAVLSGEPDDADLAA